MPRRTSGNLSEKQIGFYLDEDRLILIEDSGFLLPFMKSLEKTPLGRCTLSYLIQTLLESLIEDDALDLERLEDKLAKSRRTCCAGFRIPSMPQSLPTAGN